MNDKKIIFVIVEGMSDEISLDSILNKIYSKNSLYIEIMHCDLTTKKLVTPANILSHISNLIKRYIANYHVKKKDFQQIIQLVDTDGAFIPDDNIVQDDSIAAIYYSDTEIRTNNSRAIIQRNKQKRENLLKLIGTDTIWGIPYRVFYMSCNLDHVLHDKQNATEKEKEDDSYTFADRYGNDIPGFWNFFSKSDFSIMIEYKESWNFIRKDLHSLGRFSNFCGYVSMQFKPD